jgi:hypothetical protein
VHKAFRPCGGVAALLAVLLCAGSARAQETVESAVKATYLYKFAPFVDWPQGSFASAEEPFTVCIIGHDPFGAVLDQAVKGQRIGSRAVEIKRMGILGPNSGCRIAYVGGSPEQSIGEALEFVRGTPILTVTDGADNMPRGIIRFVLDNNHVRFEIDDAAAAQNDLVISSKLLSLARSVKPRRQP